MAVAGAHRYWRIFIVTGYNSSWIDINEIELRASAGGSDITTPSTPVTASSAYSGRAASAVVDNSTSSMWTNNGGGSANNWLWFDLTTPTAVAEVALYSGGSIPATVKIQYSDDDSTWTDATSTITLPNVSSWQTIAVEQAPPDPNAPQKTTPTLSVSSAAWSNPTYVLADDAQRASVVKTTENSSILNLSWADTLPANALLIGIVVKVKGYVSSTASGAYWLPTMNLPTITPTTTETLYTLGSASALPSGYTAASRPTSAMFLAYQNTSANTTHYVNYISVELWWKLPGGGVNVLFLGECF